MRHLDTHVLYFGQQTARMNVPDNVWKIHRYMMGRMQGADIVEWHRSSFGRDFD